ncbi:MAG: hypothetical protein WCW52_04075 [Elusimicrobiales bacterium]|jgi:hypothetical protein
METRSIAESVGRLAKEIKRFAARAVTGYGPVVNYLLLCRSKDARRITAALDGLLDFCWDPDALLLFHKLCRYYHDIDPRAAEEYARRYREMWN